MSTFEILRLKELNEHSCFVLFCVAFFSLIIWEYKPLLCSDTRNSFHGITLQDFQAPLMLKTPLPSLGGCGAL